MPLQSQSLIDRVSWLLPFSSSSSSNTLVRNALWVGLLASILGATVASSINLILPARVSMFGSTFSRLFGNKVGLDKWIESERQFAWKRLLRNISPPGTDPGCVVAAPSRKDPDYWYQWTRDSAMVFKVVVEYWKRDLNPHGKDATFKLIMDYVNESRKMQRMETPSGGFKTGGLGEVKYNDDGTAFKGNWGRPQFDGPALRASAVIAFCNELLDSDAKRWESWIRKEIYDGLPYETTEALVKADLDFVAKVWNETCFDLWEEQTGLHHFNMLITVRAMYDGSRFASRLGDSASSSYYLDIAQKVQDSLAQFWDKQRGYIVTAIETQVGQKKLSLLDTGTVLGFLHSGDLDACISGNNEKKKTSSSDNIEFLGSDKSMITQLRIAESMRNVYPINKRYTSNNSAFVASSGDNAHGYAIGRYQEDSYDGDGKRKTGEGNPWHLCTLAHAEFYYRLAHYFKDRSIQINSLNKEFFEQIGSSSSANFEEGQTYNPRTHKEHAEILSAFRIKGDGFMKVVRDNARWNGGLWEQFEKHDGGIMGAPHLTWSYASFLSAEQARNSTPMFV